MKNVNIWGLFEEKCNTVKSQLEAAASIFLKWVEVRPLYKGGYYLRAASIKKILSFCKQTLVKTLKLANICTLFCLIC